MAVICKSHQNTYSELKERVDALAGAFGEMGFQLGDKVAIISENCHTFLETYFSAAKLGIVLVPINYRLIPSDFIYILNDSQAKALIAQPKYLTWLSERIHELPRIEKIILTSQPQASFNFDYIDYENTIEQASTSGAEPIKIHSLHPAQIYYTSGTTGRPKGVVLSHNNNEVHALGTIKELDLTGSDRWLHVAPMFHLADSWAVWSITLVGGVHVIIPCFEQDSVLQAISQHKVTLSNFIPTMLNVLINNPNITSYDLASLRLVLSGGAPVAKEIVRRVMDIFNCHYIQTYGLTETSPFLTMSILPEGHDSLSFEEKFDIMVTTGRPFYNVQLRVVKEDGTEVLPNDQDVGEIIVKGETITSKYWNLPRETRERIRDGWLYTRDLARVDLRGYVTIVDRKDDMIITGGENVYSIEVENILYSHPAVFEACVIGLDDPVWGERVTAVLVLNEGMEATEEEIIEFCREKLAHFKAPKQVIFAEDLPKTGSSKIRKRSVCDMYKEMVQ